MHSHLELLDFVYLMCFVIIKTKMLWGMDFLAYSQRAIDPFNLLVTSSSFVLGR